MKGLTTIPPGGSIPSRQERRRKVKAWSFSEKPSFARVDRRVLVARDGDLNIDVFDESEEIVVVAQLPSVENEAYHLDVRGDTLVITATAGSGPGRVEYRGQQQFPFSVEKEPRSVSLTNYILEVRFRRSSRGKPDHGGSGTEAKE